MTQQILTSKARVLFDAIHAEADDTTNESLDRLNALAKSYADAAGLSWDDLDAVLDHAYATLTAAKQGARS